MSEYKGVMIVTADMAVKGAIRRCRRLEVMGHVEGEIVASEVIVHRGGRIVGQVKSGRVDVAGALHGDVVVDGLLSIADSGQVSGTVQYGRLAMAGGADLVADVRNMPPRLEGDFEISVTRGRSARITVADISAVDPDDAATALTFHVTNERRGLVAAMGDRARPLKTFSQADLVGGRVTFVHDGSASDEASFDVRVTDAAGADSGPAKTVTVKVSAPARSAASVWG